jgi:hypothetical protein
MYRYDFSFSTVPSASPVGISITGIRLMVAPAIEMKIAKNQDHPEYSGSDWPCRLVASR